MRSMVGGIDGGGWARQEAENISNLSTQDSLHPKHILSSADSRPSPKNLSTGCGNLRSVAFEETV